MTMQIIDPNEPLMIDHIIVTIYGAPDAGKTSLAQTSNNSFLEDYDEGLQRCVKRGKAGRIKSWDEAVEFHQSGKLKEMGIETLIVDTAGTMLDNYIARYIIKNNPKMAQADGTLQLKGYGSMKSIFNQFRIDVKAMDLDVVFLCHDTDKEENGETKKTPKLTGGSYDILKASTDLMGYMFFVNGKRQIGFDTTDNYYGKNCAELPIMEIPHYDHKDYDGFLARIIQTTKDKMNAMSEEMVEAQKQVEEFSVFIDECSSVEELEMLSDNIDEGLPRSYFVQIQKIYDDKFMNLFFDKIKGIKKAGDLGTMIDFASKQDKKYTNQMKASINKCLEANKWTYDKELTKVVPVDKKPTKDSKPVQTKIEE